MGVSKKYLILIFLQYNLLVNLPTLYCRPELEKTSKQTTKQTSFYSHFSKVLPNRSTASKREYEIKKSSRADKLKLIDTLCFLKTLQYIKNNYL